MGSTRKVQTAVGGAFFSQHYRISRLESSLKFRGREEVVAGAGPLNLPDIWRFLNDVVVCGWGEEWTGNFGVGDFVLQSDIALASRSAIAHGLFRYLLLQVPAGGNFLLMRRSVREIRGVIKCLESDEMCWREEGSDADHYMVRNVQPSKRTTFMPAWGPVRTGHCGWIIGCHAFMGQQGQKITCALCQGFAASHTPGSLMHFLLGVVRRHVPPNYRGKY